MKVRVLGIDNKLESSKQRQTDLGAMGYYDPNKQAIGIDSEHPLSTQKDTLIHEIFEILNHRLELDLDHDKLTAIGSGWHQVIEDNPHMFKNLFKGIK